MRRSGLHLHFLLQVLIAGLLGGRIAWADSTYTPTEAEANKYSVEQAAGYVQRGLSICDKEHSPQVQIMPDIIADSYPGWSLIWQFRDLHDIQLSFKDSSGGFLTRLVPETLTISAKGHFFQHGRDYSNVSDKCTGLAEDWTKVLGDALLRLKLEFDKANGPESMARFKEEAARYQAMEPKPQIPEDARRFRVQAEGAVANKRFIEAVEKYGKAIEIAPWWPEAHFNRAVVLAELQNFDSARAEMKRYLMLKPDAPDARQAQDFIYAWEAYPFKDK